MQDLRLVGVHEDGLHLLLADDEGNRFALPLDEALRAAARRDRPRLGQLQIETAGGLRPKDVQAMIRAGMTAEDVADRAGWTVEKVHRYEGPILAEREHVAGLARQVRLRPRGGSHGVAPTLDARVTERLRAREIDAGSASWDSHRTDKGAWTVVLLFNAGGRQREAMWHFDPLARTVSAVDDEARWLSEDEDQQAPGPIPAPHLSASTRPSRVYDVEAEGGLGASATRRREGETVDLMAAIRERSSQRGRRRRPKSTEVPGLDEAPEEALPLEELARDPREELPPPAHTHPEDDPEVVKTGSLEERVGVEAAARKARRTEPTQPVRQTVPAPAQQSETQPSPSEPSEAQQSETQPSPTEQSSTEQSSTEQPGTPQQVQLEDSQAEQAEIEQPQLLGAEQIEQLEAEQPDVTITASATADRTEDEGGGHRAESTQARDEAPAPERPLRPAARRQDRSRPIPTAPASGRVRVDTSNGDDAGDQRTRGTEAGRDDDAYDVVEQRPSASTGKPAPRPAAPSRKSGRPSVPSWDDIMFGRKSD